MTTAHSPLSFSTRIAHDADLHASFISGWQQDYAQLSCGRYFGRLDEVCTGRVQLFCEYASCETWQQCRPAPGRIWFGLPAPSSGASLRFAGQEVAPDSVLICPGGDEFFLRTPPAFTIGGMVVEQDLLEACCLARYGHALPPLWRQSGSLTLTPVACRQLEQSLARYLEAARSQPEQLLSDKWQWQLADILLQALATGAHAPAKRRSHLGWVEQTCRWARVPDAPVSSVDSLCQRLHVTRRTLQNGFHQAAAISPLGMLRALRLGEVRRALSSTQHAGQSIQDLALAWGFGSASQFGQDYRRQFGETPSQTRQAMRQDKQQANADALPAKIDITI
ncbi:helix-turn-helix domain-containing protein [Rhodobacteraceae bacterium CH30]|nr:helix-turn-helix domain-containing protein [Rhodobacteraceae bacterium CH30]